MTENECYASLAPFIRDYIYRKGWDRLRPIQIAACDVIMNSDSHLLLSSGTASGKTEAAFLPALTELFNRPSSSVGILYISPLKALINDQFGRIENLLEEANIPVTKWHGDASMAKKNKLIKNPSGVMQTTPESIESLLMNKSGAIYSLFCDLRFIIIDEVHYFMDSPRGLQLQSQLERITRLINANKTADEKLVIPRRIGLSATISDYSGAEEFLSGATGIKTVTPQLNEPSKRVRLMAERFVMRQTVSPKVEQLVDDIDYTKIAEFLVLKTMGKKAIIFCNTRAETEIYCSRCKKYAEDHHLPDVYRIHHGSLSRTIRESAEKQMKSEDSPLVTAATITLELGIDLGSLDRIIQIGTPFSVSSFVQRLGRSGRNETKVPEMIFCIIDEDKNDTVTALDEINWDMLFIIAIVEIYTKEKWVEPISVGRFNFSLLYHQTMSYLCTAGSVTSAKLAEDILTLPPFRFITKEDYKFLLQNLIDIGHIAKDERGRLTVGFKAEPIVDSFQFYSVFETEEEFTVKCKGEIIGSVATLFTPGSTFALAGKAWKVTAVDEKAKVIAVAPLEGSARIFWLAEQPIAFHTKVIRKVREILRKDTGEIDGKDYPYPYLSKSCRERLSQIQNIAKIAELDTKQIIKIGADKYAIFPWVGTRELYTLGYALTAKDEDIKIIPKNNLYAECEFEGSAYELERFIKDILASEINPYKFHIPKEQHDKSDSDPKQTIPKQFQVPGKFNKFIPSALLRKQFAEDFCDVPGLKAECEF
ncbi:MAG: DEAD/DEAH box helicase [Ruminococcus sp.]|jgi:ATP-dependent Lhr-like helicase|nr:DEAD/DEAH box helicase [Ruminococcus sp.]